MRTWLSDLTPCENRLLKKVGKLKILSTLRGTNFDVNKAAEIINTIPELLNGLIHAYGLTLKKPLTPRQDLKKAGNKSIPGYKAWENMKRLCYAPGADKYECYGGRGIGVHPAWRKSFNSFIEDMGPRPSRKHWLIRLDTNKDYEPGNVIWSLKRPLRGKGLHQ